MVIGNEQDGTCLVTVKSQYAMEKISEVQAATLFPLLCPLVITVSEEKTWPTLFMQDCFVTIVIVTSSTS
jgi:hypothetical protein